MKSKIKYYIGKTADGKYVVARGRESTLKREDKGLKLYDTPNEVQEHVDKLNKLSWILHNTI